MHGPHQAVGTPFSYPLPTQSPWLVVVAAAARGPKTNSERPPFGAIAQTRFRRYGSTPLALPAPCAVGGDTHPEQEIQRQPLQLQPSKHGDSPMTCETRRPPLDSTEVESRRRCVSDRDCRANRSVRFRCTGSGQVVVPSRNPQRATSPLATARTQPYSCGAAAVRSLGPRLLLGTAITSLRAREHWLSRLAALADAVLALHCHLRGGVAEDATLVAARVLTEDACVPKKLRVP